MKVQCNKHGIYNPRKAGGGCACDIQSDDKGCFVKFGKQEGTEMHKFDWKNAIGIKLGMTDLGMIMAYFHDKTTAKDGELKIFHKFSKDGKETQTSIVIKPYENRGLTFGVYRGEDKAGVLLSHGDIAILKVLFTDAILRASYTEFEIKDKENA